MESMDGLVLGGLEDLTGAGDDPEADSITLSKPFPAVFSIEAPSVTSGPLKWRGSLLVVGADKTRPIRRLQQILIAAFLQPSLLPVPYAIRTDTYAHQIYKSKQMDRTCIQSLSTASSLLHATDNDNMRNNIMFVNEKLESRGAMCRNLAQKDLKAGSENNQREHLNCVRPAACSLKRDSDWADPGFPAQPPQLTPPHQ
ncbi:hypothetical protein EYF80_024923 [Liparis tanakae]|uniref:Uncharacterized protein n=1 Tax=Liparis tanakae TaxID=230148 RepID=A0A4Z2HIZ8_9TELE|nr:hypothetical protein EYF80_024923 [Liparis tanakae]